MVLAPRSRRRNVVLNLLLQFVAAIYLQHQSAVFVCEGLGQPLKNDAMIVHLQGPTLAHKKTMANRQAFLSTILGGAVVTMASAALPASAFVGDPSVYNHEYADPLHHSCKRRIEVSKDGKTFHYSGTAVGPKDDPVSRGCSNDEIRQHKLRFESFDGFVRDDGRISAGDNAHEGVWEPAGSVSASLEYEDVDGIRWNDGNKWIVQKKPLSTKVGEVITFSYIGFSILAGGSELLKRALVKQEEA